MGKQKILIIDDEEMILSMLKTCLQAEDFLVYTADSAKKALELLSAAPDLILLDINMPGMNGLEVLQRLKEEEYPGKIIMLTCYDEFAYVREALRAGAADYVLKSDLNESCLSDAVLRLEYGDEGQSGEETASSQKIRSEKYLRQMIDGWSLGEKGELKFHPQCFCAVTGRIREMEKITARYAGRAVSETQ